MLNDHLSVGLQDKCNTNKSILVENISLKEKLVCCQHYYTEKKLSLRFILFLSSTEKYILKTYCKIFNEYL